MEPFNNTSLKLAWLPGMLQAPNHSLTIVVKGCFDLLPDEKAVFSKDLDAANVMGDTFINDNPTASLVYANDLVVYKPKADLTLTGVAYPQCGTAGCHVSFGVGNWRKSLAVFNDRFWSWGSASTPQPFTNEASAAIPLIYENAYGGETVDFNPVGKGANRTETQNGENVQALPNIEHVNNVVSSPSQKTLPAGFGPLKDGWGDKAPLEGTYDDKWLKQTFPAFPADFNLGYFNTAPQDQQVDYLRGDETLYFENLRPDLHHYKSQLPSIRPRLFVKGDVEQNAIFHEVTLRLDTLHVDMEKQQVNLVWRGLMGVLSDEYEELAHACLYVEDMAEDQLSSKYYLQCFNETEAQKETEFAIEEFENAQGEDLPIEGEKLDKDVSDSPEEAVEEEGNAELDTLFGQLKSQLQAAGVADHLVDMLNADMDAEVFNQKVFETYNIQSVAPEKFIEKSQQDTNKLMAELGYEPIDFARSVAENAKHATQNAEVELTKSEHIVLMLEGNTDFKGMDLTAADLSNRDLSNRNFRGADLTKANLSGANISGSDFTEADMSQCVIEEVNAQGAVFDHAILTGVCAIKANFTKISALSTQFQHAQLVKVNFTNADLGSADFTASIMPGCLFQETDLSEASFERADLSEAQFIQANAVDAYFTAANMRGCFISKSDFREANLSEVNLTLGNIEHSDLSEARLESVSAQSLKVLDCSLDKIRAAQNSDFAGAQFVGGNAIGAIFDRANLTGALFKTVLLQTADFSNTDLSGASFKACDMQNTYFVKATALDTVLSGLNLFQANFSKAKLTRTDLRLSNLYGAEFFQAQLDNTRLNGANIQQTKIDLGMVKRHG